MQLPPAKFFGAFVGVFLFCCVSASAAITVSSESDDGIWRQVYGNFDYNNDQQTGQRADDIIGSPADATGYSVNPGFLTAYDAPGNELAFRVRLNAGSGKSYYDGYISVGIDVDRDYAVDAYINYSSKGGTSSVRIFSPGAGLNISPSTTTMVAPKSASYNITDPSYSSYRAVTTGDGGTTLDAGGDGNDDWYASFKINYSLLLTFLQDANEMNTAKQGQNPAVIKAFTPSEIAALDPTRFGYIVGSSTQDNALNQDVGGINGNTDTPWVNGPMGNLNPVPEPSGSILTLIGIAGMLLRRRRSQ